MVQVVKSWRNEMRQQHAAEDFADMLDAEASIDEEFDKETAPILSEAEISAKATEAELIAKQAEEDCRCSYCRNPRPYSMMTAEEIAQMPLCKGCGVDTDVIEEYYMVQFELWKSVVPRVFQNHELCIGCLEGYLGRQLDYRDFIEAPVNYTRHDKSARLLERLGQWFRLLDGPYTEEVSQEMDRREELEEKRRKLATEASE